VEFSYLSRIMNTLGGETTLALIAGAVALINMILG
jgi:hypothetical protein